MPPHIPKYRRRPDRDVAFAEYPRGQRSYFPGRYDSPESRAAYNRWLRAVLVEPDAAVPSPPNPANVLVIDLVNACLDWARLYYLNNGKVGSEYHCLRSAAIPLVKAADTVPVRDFGPRDLKRARQEMVARGWTRQTVNDQVVRIRRIFRWGVEHEFVPADVLAKLKAVAPLRKGKTALREGDEVKPVEDAQVAMVLPQVGPVVAAMIELQRAAAMRPQDVCRIRPMDVDRSGDVWLYLPPEHKGDWREDEQHSTRIVFLGPAAQKILAPWLDRPDDAYCFSPVESEQHRAARRRCARKTPLRFGAKPSTGQPARSVRTHYDTASYRRAIRHAIDAINDAARTKAENAGKPAPAPIPYWSPNQLRHSMATAVRRRYGIEAAQVYLGHAKADVTQVYAERDLELAKRVARGMG